MVVVIGSGRKHFGLVARKRHQPSSFSYCETWFLRAVQLWREGLEMVSLLCVQEKHAQEVRRNKELREALTA